MSGGPGGGVPACVEDGSPSAGTFASPLSAEIFTPGEDLSIEIWTGQTLSDLGPGTEMTMTFTLYAYNESSSQYLNIATNAIFKPNTSSWTYGDPCGDAMLMYSWQVPKDVGFSSTSEYYILASNDSATYWKSDAITILPSASATSTASASASATTTTSSTSSSAPAESSHAGGGGGGGLSTGAKAGIGVGAALGGIILLLCAGVLIFRRRRGRGSAGAGAGAAAGGEGEGTSRPAAGRYEKAELDAKSVQERPPSAAPAELPIQPVPPAELPAL